MIISQNKNNKKAAPNETAFFYIVKAYCVMPLLSCRRRKI